MRDYLTRPRPERETDRRGLSLIEAGNPLKQALQGLFPGLLILELPYSDSIDASFPLECFFQMPARTKAVRTAKVWVQQKPFRMYSAQSTPSGGGSTSSSDGSHNHSLSGGSASGSTDGAVPANDATGTGGSTDAQLNHDHTDPQGGNTGVNGAHSHLVNSHSHNHNHGSHSHTVGGGAQAFITSFPSVTSSGGTHNHSTPNHTHTLTAGIFESGPTGTMSLAVADDGATYGGSIVTGATIITAQDLTGLTKAVGDKRIKITGTGLMRVQVLIVLELVASVAK